MELINFGFLSFVSLFAIVDPVAVVPAFLSMTQGNSGQERLRMARIASIVTFGVLSGFALAGLLGPGDDRPIGKPASNLVSGLFLIAERPFAVGDTIRIGGTTGEVLSVDLLSVKLRTLDNLFVRIPNESIIKSEITNLTRFPIRRLDLQISVAYKEDLKRVFDLLLAVADRNPLSLEEPKPIFIVLGFGDSGINVQFSLWAARRNFLELRNTIQTEIKKSFEAAGVEIPFPHRTLYAGAVSEPFPVRLFENTQREAQR